MRKMIAVIDEPEWCLDCPLCYSSVGLGYDCKLSNRHMERLIVDGRPDWCPLRKIPEKKDICGTYDSDYYKNGGELPSYKIGWNKCVDYILGEENE